MNIVLWMVAGLLAAAFLFAGSFKLSHGNKVVEKGMAWAEDFSDTAVRGIGLAEMLGALGLILPAATGVATWLVPVSAALLFVTMVGAVITHVRRKEPAAAAIPAAVLGALALFVAIGRFAIAPFGG